MAYDPNDAADKKILKDAIDAALTAQATEHETEIQGLKDKNKELLGKIKKGETSSEDVDKLEAQIEENKTQIKQLNKDLKAANKIAEDATKGLETETGLNRNLLVDGGLTAALVKANVAPEFLPAVKALLKDQVTIKTEGDNRKAVVGDKDLEAFVTEWSQGDQGKVYISTGLNGGSGAPGGQGQRQTGKTLTRTAFEAIPPEQRGAALQGVTLVDG